MIVPMVAVGQSGFIVGGQAGINMANVTLDPEQTGTTLSARTGIMVGVHAETAINDMFSVRPELTYIQRGVKSEGTFGTTTFTSTVKADYISVPILLKASFGKGAFVPVAVAGPYIAFNMKSEMENSGGGTTATVDNKDNTEAMDFGLVFGAGGQYMLNAGTTVFGHARYALGLSNVDKTPGSTTKAKHKGIQLIVGVSIAM
jgi:hypothetical protein